MPGPPRKPTSLKLVQGNPGKRALSKKEPQPSRGIPGCPDWLSPRAKEAWAKFGAELDEMAVLTLADRGVMELIVVTYDEWRTAIEDCERLGERTYETTTEGGGRMFRTYPEFAAAADAGKRLRGLLTDCGLTPSARSKVQTRPGAEDDDFDVWKKRGGR